MLIPVLNGGSFVADAIASVQRQGERDLELLVHDDGSTDETPTVLENLAAQDRRIVLSRSATRGIAATRNRLLTKARGEYVAFLDHDDLWPDGRLLRQLAALQAAPASPAVLGETLLFEALDAQGRPARTPRLRRVLAGLLQAGLFRRSALLATGQFAEELALSEDVDFLLRLVETCGPLLVERDVAAWYRLHLDQSTANLKLAGQGTVRALARSMARRRARGDAGPMQWGVPA